MQQDRQEMILVIINFSQGGDCMDHVKHLKTEDETEISQTQNRTFYQLYKQAVLQELKEQGIIDDCQLQLCLQKLSEKK